MRFKMLVFAAAAISVTLPAVAQTNDSSATTPKKEKKTCRRYAVTGSIVGVKAECHTATEWTAIDAINQKGVDDTLGNGRVPGAQPNG